MTGQPYPHTPADATVGNLAAALAAAGSDPATCMKLIGARSARACVKSPTLLLDPKRRHCWRATDAWLRAHPAALTRTGAEPNPAPSPAPAPAPASPIAAPAPAPAVGTTPASSPAAPEPVAGPLPLHELAALLLDRAKAAGVDDAEIRSALAIDRAALMAMALGAAMTEPAGLRARAVDALDAWNNGRRIGARPKAASAPAAAQVRAAAHVTNAEFVMAIFGGLDDDKRAYVVSFAGDPDNAPGWGGSPWSPGVDIERPKHNNYLSLASYRPDANGDYHRRKAQCAAVHALILDDIGTKAAPVSRLGAAPPSWLIETSPGNFQAGYIMATPITDLTLADSVQAMLVALGLCDPGATGPSARLARMPVGFNGKAK